MKIQPNISIVIPVYNVEKYLRRCLDSIISQNLTNIEIICINDGSTDHSTEILEEYSQKDKRVIVLNQTNQGLSVTRNTGIKIANGEYVGFVDSDDFVDSDFFEKMYNTAVKLNADIVCAGIVRENDKKKKILLQYNNSKTYSDTKAKLIAAGIPEHNYSCNKIYKRELIQNNIFKAGILYEDILFTSNIIEKSNILAVTPNTFYHYWKHSNTLVKDDSDSARFDKYNAHEYLNCVCEKYKLDNPKNYKYKENIEIFGIPVMRKIEYKMTTEYYLFGIFPIVKRIRRA